MRKVSLGARLGPGYVHSILKDGKDPTIDNLISVCREVGVSLSFVMYGLDIDRDVEELLLALSEADPKRREAALTLLRGSGRAEARLLPAPPDGSSAQ